MVIVDLDENDLDASDMTIDQVTDALAARLGPEACYDANGNPIRGKLVSAADITGAYPLFLDALSVSIDTTEEEDWIDRGYDPKDAETVWVAVERLYSDLSKVTS